MEKFYSFLIFAILCVNPLFAQRNRPEMPEEKRQEWLATMRNYKHEYLVKELDLTKEQQKEFFPVYDQMDDQLTQIAEEIRDYERKITSNEELSDTEYNAASHAFFQQSQLEGEIQMSYYEKFQKILTPKQLARLKMIERQFVNHLMKEHHQRRQKN